MGSRPMALHTPCACAAAVHVTCGCAPRGDCLLSRLPCFSALFAIILAAIQEVSAAMVGLGCLSAR